MLVQQLKKLCGSGGTVKDDVIEIQGDHCKKVQAKLSALGYKVKRAGGYISTSTRANASLTLAMTDPPPHVPLLQTCAPQKIAVMKPGEVLDE
jgi:hypothetical protein